ncbi:type II secretion system F family protein [Synechococcus sp. CS-1325]|uniref:type II secretion system F family protein n=1 Tax=Synechococcus sp. CS-1325 TaxID=2847979 RepID=UPI000DB1AFEC|nr:type II secretion system F family protein [Synechococcus sp. CS-1325]MCT0199166.1 type II secretion system F family protein [Synechococcus sp. CS-1325]PZU96592.1 MAG: pilus assembly protein PilC [Cyanobium sp.]
MASFLATFTTPRGETRELQVTAVDVVSARRDLRRRGIVPSSLIPARTAAQPSFAATYTDRQGRTKQQQITAADLESARRELRRRGIRPSSIIPLAATRSSQATQAKAKAGNLLSRDLGAFFEAKPTIRDKALFANKLSALVDSGVPIVRSLTLLAAQQKKPLFRRALVSIGRDISEGESLGKATRKWPKVFDRLSVAMIEAGELGGVLDETLQRLALLLEQNARLQNQVKGAMGYPVAVLVIAVLVFLGMTIFLIPTFATIFEQLGADLPPFTQLMVNISALLRSPFSIYLIGVIVIAAWLFRGFYKTPVGRRQVDGALLKLPLFGDLIQKTATAQFCRTFSSLSRAGVPILMALEIVRETTNNSVIGDAIEAARSELQNGIPLSVALSKKKVFPEMALSMLEVGEETGEMDKMLSKVADFYEDEVAAAVKALTSLLEPVMIVLVGIIVAAILLAMYLPMFSIYDKIR